MNCSAKGFRVVSSILILLNLAVFFLPVAVCTQENYGAVKLTQLGCVKAMVSGKIPDGEMNIAADIRSVQMVIIFLMVLPLILSVITGIWGIVGSYKQMISSILAFFVLALYIGMYLAVSKVWPEAGAGQVYERGIACTLHLVCSAGGALAALAAMFCTPKKVQTAQIQVSIPQVKEIKQQQVEAKYNIITESSDKKPEYKPGEPRGVMVGLNGMYAGAEISLTNGEYIKLGRQADNHLVFEGQPNVSRSHCRIRWDAGRKKYIFCDYSSNGSFVNGSQDCLPQNLEIEMEPGTVVAIGDETNTFRLE